MEVGMAVALADSIKADWIALPLDQTRNALDHDQPTEILRRVSGFISIVDGLLRPILKPTQDEAAAAAASSRAENVIERVVAHLRCNRAYYVQQFLDYLWRQTRGFAFSDLLARVLQAGGMQQINEMLQSFNPRAGFIDGFQFVVPLYHEIDNEAALRWIDQISGAPAIEPIGEFANKTTELVIPCDGFHLEPLPGLCLLPDLPEQASSVTAAITVGAQGS
jgi:hypothetical protein